MPVRIGSGLSTSPDPRAAAVEASLAARRGLHGAPCDLVVLFAAGRHLSAPEATIEGVQEALEPGEIVGCGAGGVIGACREVEDGTAVSVWAAHLGEDASASVFHTVVEEL